MPSIDEVIKRKKKKNEREDREQAEGNESKEKELASDNITLRYNM